jgi:hypothetical protein
MKLLNFFLSLLFSLCLVFSSQAQTEAQKTRILFDFIFFLKLFSLIGIVFTKYCSASTMSPFIFLLIASSSG